VSKRTDSDSSEIWPDAMKAPRAASPWRSLGICCQSTECPSLRELPAKTPRKCPKQYSVKMNAEEIILLYVRRKIKINKKKKKKLWMHPFLGDRFVSGPFHNLYGNLRKSEGLFCTSIINLSVSKLSITLTMHERTGEVETLLTAGVCVSDSALKSLYFPGDVAYAEASPNAQARCVLVGGATKVVVPPSRCRVRYPPFKSMCYVWRRCWRRSHSVPVRCGQQRR
jgi:hypothetical protein